MKRQYTNAFLGGGWLISFVWWVLDMVGRFQTAKSIYDSAAVKIPGITINWGFLYFCALVMCSTLLVAVNFDLIVRFWLLRKEANERTWNLAAKDAIYRLGRLCCT